RPRDQIASEMPAAGPLHGAQLNLPQEGIRHGLMQNAVAVLARVHPGGRLALKARRTRVPRPTSLVIVQVPPCSAAIVRTSARPSPTEPPPDTRAGSAR